jgi:hypothetical protein
MTEHDTPQSPSQDGVNRQLSEALKGLRGALKPQPESQAFFASPEPAGGTPPRDARPAGQASSAPEKAE